MCAACYDRLAEIVADLVARHELDEHTGDLLEMPSLVRALRATLGLHVATEENCSSRSTPDDNNNDDNDDMVVIVANVFVNEDEGQTCHVVRVQMADLPVRLRHFVRNGSSGIRQGAHDCREIALREATKVLSKADCACAWRVATSVVDRVLQRALLPSITRYPPLYRIVHGHHAPLALHVDDVSKVIPFPDGRPITDEEKEEAENNGIRDVTAYDDPAVSFLSFVLHRTQNSPAYVPNYLGGEACVTNIRTRVVSCRREWFVMLFGGGTD